MVTFVGIVRDPRWTAEPWSTDGVAADLAAAFAGWHDSVRRIVAAAGVDGGRWALYDREPLARWSTARATLLGDAAHPMLPHFGQGANQAIEDAAALAVCLAEISGGDVAAALDRYDAIRRPHTTRIQHGARSGGLLRLRPADTDSTTLPSMVDNVSWIQRYDVERELAGTR
jgi:salicylate hydroxylase